MNIVAGLLCCYLAVSPEVSHFTPLFAGCEDPIRAYLKVLWKSSTIGNLRENKSQQKMMPKNEQWESRFPRWEENLVCWVSASASYSLKSSTPASNRALQLMCTQSSLNSTFLIESRPKLQFILVPIKLWCHKDMQECTLESTSPENFSMAFRAQHC